MVSGLNRQQEKSHEGSKARSEAWVEISQRRYFGLRTETGEETHQAEARAMMGTYYLPGHPRFWRVGPRMEKVRRRMLKMCARAAIKTIEKLWLSLNRVAAEARSSRYDPEKVIVFLKAAVEAERAFEQMIAAGDVEAIDDYVALKGVIDRLQETCLKQFGAEEIGFGSIGDAAD
jgi:hypothetical protein